MILIVTTMIVWMTQVLQRIYIIVEYGQGFGLFMFLSVLIIPSLVAIIMPFAVFGATIYALYRFHSDSELAVMFAAGVSRWRLSAPILLLAMFGAAATLYINADLMPRSYRILEQSVANIRADFGSTLLRGGEFTTIVDGFTIYVDEARPGGQFVGLMIHDYRNKESQETYMAERAIMEDTENGPVMLLKRGNIQRVAPYTGDVRIIRFDEWTISLGSIKPRYGDRQLEFIDRYPSELLNPDLSKPYDREHAGELIAEGHARLVSPLYVFAYVLIGLYAMIGGSHSRQEYFLRTTAATAGVFGCRMLGFLAQGYVESSGAYWLLYAIPTIVALFFAVLLFSPFTTLLTSARSAAQGT